MSFNIDLVKFKTILLSILSRTERIIIEVSCYENLEKKKTTAITRSPLIRDGL